MKRKIVYLGLIPSMTLLPVFETGFFSIKYDVLALTLKTLSGQGDTLQLSVEPPSATAYIYNVDPMGAQAFGSEEQVVRYVISVTNLLDQPLQLDWEWAEYTFETRAKVTIGGGPIFIPPHATKHYYLRVAVSPAEVGQSIQTTMIAWGFGRDRRLGQVQVTTHVAECHYPADSLIALSGRVVDSTAGQGLGADIYAYAPTRYYIKTTCAPDGHFTLYLPPLEHVIQVTFEGYYTAYRIIHPEKHHYLPFELDPVIETIGSGEALWTFPPPGQEPIIGWLNGAAASPSWDAFALVTEVQDFEHGDYGEIYFLNGSGEVQWNYQTSNDPLKGVVFSEDGFRIAAIGKNLYMFDRSGRLEWTEFAQGRVIKFKGERVVVGGEDGVIRCYDAADGRHLWDFGAEEGMVRDVAISGDGGRVVAGTQSGRVVVLDMATGELLFDYWAENNAFAVAIAQNSGHIGVASWDGALHYLNATGTPLWRFQTNRTLRSVVISPDGDRVAFTGRGIYLVNQEGQIIWHTEQEMSNNWSAMSADGRYFFFPGGEGTPGFLFNAEGTRLLIPQIQGEMESIWFVLMKDDASLLAIPDRLGRLYVYEGVLDRGSRGLKYTCSPAPGDTSVPVDTRCISVFFNRPVLLIQDLEEIPMQIVSDGDTLTPVSVEVKPWQIDIDLTGLLERNKVYVVTLPAGLVQDFDGNTNPEISWSFSTGKVSSIGQGNGDESIPQQFLLQQNYPNPFNAETIIRYALPKSTRVRLHVYDILGREVATLVDQHQEAGYHAVRWDADGMVSGIYFYQLQADRFSQIRKLVILK